MDFDNAHMRAMIVEDKRMFVGYLEELIAQQSGENGRFTLHSDESQVEIRGHLKTVTDPFDLDCNVRDILAGVQSDLISCANGEQRYLETSELIGDINAYLEKLNYDLDLSIDFKEVVIQDLIKLANPRVHTSGKCLLERICDYLALLTRYSKIQVVVFAGLVNYLSREDMILFREFVDYNSINVLLMESHTLDPSCFDNLTIIDSDLCELYR